MRMVGGFWRKTRIDVVDGLVAVVAGDEVEEHAAEVGASGAGEEGFDRGVLAGDVGQFLDFGHHVVVGGSLGGFDDGEDAAVVFVGDEDGGTWGLDVGRRQGRCRGLAWLDTAGRRDFPGARRVIVSCSPDERFRHKSFFIMAVRAVLRSFKLGSNFASGVVRFRVVRTRPGISRLGSLGDRGGR